MGVLGSKELGTLVVDATSSSPGCVLSDDGSLSTLVWTGADDGSGSPDSSVMTSASTNPENMAKSPNTAVSNTRSRGENLLFVVIDGQSTFASTIRSLDANQS
jgi:hypothetical protein